MQLDVTQIRKMLSDDLSDILIRFSLVVLLAYFSIKIFSPFMGVMMWALFLAVTLSPLHQKAVNKLGGKPGSAATLLVVLGILLIGVPTVLLGSSAAEFIADLNTSFENNTVTIKAPAPSVAEWPVVGQKIFDVWTLAANDLPALVEKLQPQLGNFSKALLSFVGGAVSGILQFIFSLIIAGIMMAYGERGSEAIRKIICRLAGAEKGSRLHTLSTATIRSVSLGVIGVAFIQALLLGVGYIWAGIPGAGLLAIVTLVLGIAQVPAMLITLPVIAFVWWSGDSTVTNTVLTVYFIIAGLADNVLKPLFLGRGVDAPMPIILLGALGGMVSAGLIGLFVGAVLLALGYVIFMEWVASVEHDDGSPATENGNETRLAGE
jgi:predicted PurR-regulated permease PerM